MVKVGKYEFYFNNMQQKENSKKVLITDDVFFISILRSRQKVGQHLRQLIDSADPW